MLVGNVELKHPYDQGSPLSWEKLPARLEARAMFINCIRSDSPGRVFSSVKPETF